MTEGTIWICMVLGCTGVVLGIGGAFIEWRHNRNMRRYDR